MKTITVTILDAGMDEDKILFPSGIDLRWFQEPETLPERIRAVAASHASALKLEARREMEGVQVYFLQPYDQRLIPAYESALEVYDLILGPIYEVYRSHVDEETCEIKPI